MDSNEKLLDRFAEFLQKNFSGSSKEEESKQDFDLPSEDQANSHAVIKAVSGDEQRKALFVVLEPQEGVTTTDLHGDTYSEEDVEKACDNFNLHCRKANIFHKVMTEKALITQSFITPTEFTIGDSVIKKGTWLQWWHFPEGDDTSNMLWKAVKDGEITGVSIGARAETEKLDG